MKITLSGSMIEVTIRRQPAQIMEILRDKAYQIVQHEEPTPPKTRIEIAPNEYREIDNIDDEQYQQAFQLFQRKVTTEFTKMLWQSIADIGVVDTITEEDVASVRVGYQKLGIDIPEDPKLFWLQFIVAPTIEDFQVLMYEIYGKSLPKERQVAMYKRLFQGEVSEQGD